MSELEIKPVKRLEIKDDCDFHPNLPCIQRNNGSTILLVGGTGTGKTTLLVNMLYNKYMWGRSDKRPMGAFDGVFVWSPSIYLDDTARFMLNDFVCSDTFKNEDLDKIKENQLMLPKEERGKIMLVIDDSVGLDVLKTKSALTYYATRNRHLNANIIVSVQNYRSCNSIIRNNAKCIILMYGIYNSKELEKINDEVGDTYRQTLLYCYKKYCNKKYTFLTLYPREVPCRMILNFTTEIDWKKEVKNAKNFKLEQYESDNDVDEDEDELE
jgi:GTPase SAR1 family protein